MDPTIAQQVLTDETRWLAAIGAIVEGDIATTRAGDEPPLDRDGAGNATDLCASEVEASLRRSVEDERTEVEAAWARLADGSYGTCRGCGAAIPDERLEAVPATAWCVVCEERLERQLARARPPELDVPRRRRLGENRDRSDEDDPSPPAEEGALHVTTSGRTGPTQPDRDVT